MVVVVVCRLSLYVVAVFGFWMMLLFCHIVFCSVRVFCILYIRYDTLAFLSHEQRATQNANRKSRIATSEQQKARKI